MTAEREALKLGIDCLTVLFPTEFSSFDFQVECTDRTVHYKLNAQSLRLFGLHRDVNDAHRAGANRLQKQTNKRRLVWPRIVFFESSSHEPFMPIPDSGGGRLRRHECPDFWRNKSASGMLDGTLFADG